MGPIELLSCLLHLPLFQSVQQSEDLNGCVGLSPAGLPRIFLHFQRLSYSFATVAPSMGFLQSVSRARCGKHDTVRRQSLPSFLHRLTHHWFDHCSAITLEISKNKQRSGKHDTVCRPAIIPASSSIVVHCSLLLRLKLKDLEELIEISQFE